MNSRNYKITCCDFSLIITKIISMNISADKLMSRGGGKWRHL